VTAKTGGAKSQRKTIQQVVHYALAHKTRVQILTVLNEGPCTAAQIADTIGEPLNNVSNHLRHLLIDGAIEIAGEEQSGNITRYSYRAVEIPYCSREEAEAMPWGHRQMHAGFAVQWSFAEAMAALWAGKLADPRTWLYGDWYHVDQQGRTDLEIEQERYAERMKEIEAESLNRVAESGEGTTSMLVTLFGYERARNTSKLPYSRNRDRSS
jgi:DNA-binding transcriptional ArsR family regulator